MNAVIYEDAPRYDTLLKAIMVLPVFFIIMGAYYLIAGQVEDATGMFATTLLMGAIYWAIFPRKYQILENRLRIVLGGPFHFDIPLDNVEIARKPEGVSLGINFVTCFSSKNAVEVIRKRGMRVAITPSDRDLFLENLNKVLNDWIRQKGKM
jgi:hypothetical protein